MALISIHFLPHFFSFAIQSYLYEIDFTLGPIKKNIFKSSYNWFKIDILRLARPLPYSAQFRVTSTTIYIHKRKLKLCAKRVLAVWECF